MLVKYVGETVSVCWWKYQPTISYIFILFTNIHFSPLFFINIRTVKNQSKFGPTHFWSRIFRKWWTRVILLNRFWYSEWIGTTLPDIFFVSKPSRLNWIELLFNTVWKRWNFRKTWPQKKTGANWVLKNNFCRQRKLRYQNPN